MVYQVIEKIGPDEHVYDEFKSRKVALKYIGRCKNLEVRAIRLRLL